MLDHDDFAWADPAELQTRPPFSTLFPVEPTTLEAITRSMRERGYDPSRPINVWRQQNVVVEGHQRVAAALAASIREVPVSFHDFKDEYEAACYAFDSQFNRRNASDAAIHAGRKVLDKLRPRGGDKKSQKAEKSKVSSEIIDCSASQTARKLHTSASKVNASRAVAAHAKEFPDIEQAVLSGDMKLRKAAREIKERKREKSKPPPAEAAAVAPLAAPPPPVEPVSRFDAAAAVDRIEDLMLSCFDACPPELRVPFGLKFYAAARLFMTRLGVPLEAIADA